MDVGLTAWTACIVRLDGRESWSLVSVAEDRSLPRNVIHEIEYGVPAILPSPSDVALLVVDIDNWTALYPRRKATQGNMNFLR
jgi:hypothetical protein